MRMRRGLASGGESDDAPPLFTFAGPPRSAIQQARENPEQADRLIGALDAGDLPRGETTLSEGPSLIDRARRVIPNAGNYFARQGEAARDNFDTMKAGWQLATNGQPMLGAAGMASGAAGYVMSPLTAAERVLVRDPYLAATGNLKDANAAETVADTALGGGLRGPVSNMARKGVTEAMQTRRADPLANPAVRYGMAAGAGAAAMTPEESDASFLGPRAKTADITALNLAKRLTHDDQFRPLPGGMTDAQAWEQHGWGRDPAGNWKSEISDQGAKLNPDALNAWRMGFPATIGDVLDHPALFDAYPSSWSQKMAFTDPNHAGLNGSYDHMADKLRFNPELSDEKMLDTLLHELQHRHDMRFEGHQPGGSPDIFPDHAGNYRREIDELNMADRIHKAMRESGDNQWTAFRTMKDVYKDEFPTELSFSKFSQIDPMSIGQRQLELVDLIKNTKTPFDQYRSMIGEQMARLPGERIHMSDAERRENFPLDMKDHHRATQNGPIAPNHDNLDWERHKAAAEPVRSAGGQVIDDVHRDIQGLSGGGEVVRRALDALGFYSKGAEVASGLQRKSGAPQSFINDLRKQGVKPAEIDHAGFADQTKGVPSMDRQDVQHIFDNQPKIIEDIKRDWGNYERPKYEEHQLPGGDDYEERLLRSQAKPDGMQYRVFGAFPQDFKTLEEAQDYVNRFSPESLAAHPEVAAAMGPSLQKFPLSINPTAIRNPENFTGGGHWDEPNVLAHMRTSSRPVGDKNYLHLEELQSDWAQKGRDAGFADPMAEAQRAAARARFEAAMGARTDYRNFRIREAGLPTRDELDESLYRQKLPDGPRQRALEDWHQQTGSLFDNDPHMAKFDNEYRAAADASSSFKTKIGTVPQGPYVGDTGSWTDLALKRAMTRAAQDDYDGIMLSHGDVQGDRWLNQGVADYYDKTVAPKLQKMTGQQPHLSEMDNPNWVSAGSYRGSMFPDEVTAAPEKYSLPTFALTPELKDKILTQGFPTFAEGGDVEAPEAPPEPSLMDRAMSVISQFNPISSAEAAPVETIGKAVKAAAKMVAPPVVGRADPALKVLEGAHSQVGLKPAQKMQPNGQNPVFEMTPEAYERTTDMVPQQSAGKLIPRRTDDEAYPLDDRMRPLIENAKEISSSIAKDIRPTVGANTQYFYHTGPMYEGIERVAPGESVPFMDRFAKGFGGTSPRTQTEPNLRNASLLLYKDRNGLPFDSNLTGLRPKDPKGEFSAINDGGYAMMDMHKNLTRAFLDEKGSYDSNPKPSIFRNNTMGNLSDPTIDTHNIRSVLLKLNELYPGSVPEGWFTEAGLAKYRETGKFDPWAKKDFNDSLQDATKKGVTRQVEYGPMADITRLVGRKLGVETAPAQSLMWFGYGDKTNLASSARTISQLGNDRINVTAQHLGLHPDQVLKLFIDGKIPLMHAGGDVEQGDQA
jgi:hypothetical protein